MATATVRPDLSIPDSTLAKKATQLVTDVSPPFLYHHCVRVYLFGSVLGQRHGLSYDRELFYVSALLHDLGLTETFDGPQRFEVQGADAARAFVQAHGWPEEKASVVWDAIALHTSVGIADRKRPEIALVHLGAGVDVLGLQANDIAPATIEEIVASYPRLNFQQAMMQLVAAQVQQKPQIAALTWMSELGRSYLPEYTGLNWQEVLRDSPFQE
jgi:hypothetical protein